MKHILNFKILILALYIFSCNQSQRNKESPEIKSISFDPANAGTVYLEEIAKEVKFKPLATSKNFLISNIDRIFISDNLIVVVDRRQKSIFVFDENGKEKTKINAFGHGPGEYNQLTDVLFDEKNKCLEIFDGKLSKIFIYNLDGQFIKEKRIGNGERAGFKFAKFNTGYLFDRLNGANFDNDRISIFTLDNPAFVTSHLETPASIKRIFVDVYHNIENYKDTLFYIPMFDNKIYSIETKEAKPVYQINVPSKYRLTDELINNQKFKDFLSFDSHMGTTNAIYQFSNFFMSDDFIAFTYRNGSGLWTNKLVYSKKNKNTMQFSNIISKDIPNLNISGQFLTKFKDYFIVNVHSSQFHNLPRDISSALNKNSNPLLMFIKLKDF